MTSLSLLLLSSLFVLSLADLPAIHEKVVPIKVKSGGPLSLKIPAPTTIWHRKFKDGRAEQYMEACNPYLDVCEKWRSGFLGKDTHPEKVSLAKDGTLNMPKVTSADSAQYYTYYMAKDGVHHYSYFDVVVA
ncbi:hypothetical protein PRIPAC_87438 [Pristionchus pacificus]|uniref:Uncharacterized protein n=1 Tax=Pristionchus pacificus TaxID=54126 RepID=A0A454XVZ9_PRIPA|nr:hypothetical protein PRIPAC_87438 [Pristionchus pacificus]|eukprot:PDM71209.1 hypothetical protein PRIPAC_43592 [Pristionchus pacificus]